MICQLQGTVYKPRNEKVFYYETESGAEFDKNAMLCGLEREHVSLKLGDQIVRLSPYLQEVQRSIRDNIFWQKNAKDFAKMEEEIFIRRGFTKKSPGIWQRKGRDGKMYDFKETGDYPVNLE